MYNTHFSAYVLYFIKIKKKLYINTMKTQIHNFLDS